MEIRRRTKNHVIFKEPLSQQNKHVTVIFTDVQFSDDYSWASLPFGLLLTNVQQMCELGLITGEIFYIYGRIMFFGISFRNTIKKGTFRFQDTSSLGQVLCSKL